MEPSVLWSAVAVLLLLSLAVVFFAPKRVQGVGDFVQAARQKQVRKIVIRQEQRLLPSGGNSSHETGFLPRWSMHLVCTGWNRLLPVIITDIFVGTCFDDWEGCRRKPSKGMTEEVEAQLDKLRSELAHVTLRIL